MTKKDYLEHTGKTFTNDHPEDNDFDYDHINSIEQTVTDSFDQIRTFYHGDLTRLNGDCLQLQLTK